MHEFALASRIVDRASRALHSRPGARVAAIRLRLGQLSGVEVEALRFGLELLLPHGPLAGARVEIESVPPRLRCSGCGQESEVRGPPFRCPACGSEQVELVSGRELEIESLELVEEKQKCPSA
jgi:hydrogenase nickel incorporation protein HypA/HybF